MDVKTATIYGRTISVDQLVQNASVEELAFEEWRLRWEVERRQNQIPPEGDWWLIWLILAGRGFGKTRCGSETLGRWAWENPNTRWLVAAPTYSDLVSVCFEGQSGLTNVIPRELVEYYNASDTPVELKLKNGSLIQGITAEKPKRFRGPEFHGAWLDEFAAWQYAGAAFDLLMFGQRLGERPRLIISTTPQPKPEVRALLKREGKDVVITRGSTYDNEANLAPTFKKQVLQYEGTLLGRQEIHGEVLDPEEQGIVRRSWWKLLSRDDFAHMSFDFIVVSLDTAFTEETRDKKTGKTDPSACSVWGLFTDEDERPGILLLDCWEERLGFPDLLKRVPLEMAATYGEKQEPLIKSNWGAALISQEKGGRKPDLLIIEEKGSGISLRQMLEREHIFAYPYNPGKAKKIERLHSVSHLFATGLVYVLESETNPGNPVTWADPLISQVCSFSGEGTTEHDDYVDSTSQALRYLADRDFITVNPQPERSEDEDYDEPVINPYAR